jgi:hypothetical protein
VTIVLTVGVTAACRVRLFPESSVAVLGVTETMTLCAGLALASVPPQPLDATMSATVRHPNVDFEAGLN